MDKNQLDFYLQDIGGRKGVPFSMANEPLADELFQHVRVAYPDAIMVKLDISQYITVTKRARTVLIKLLAASKAKHENYIAEIETAVNQLKTEVI